MISEKILRAFCISVFESKGFVLEDASIAADVLIRADLRGIDSHGVARLSGYVRLIDAERILPNAKLSFTKRKKSAGSVDAHGGLGLVVAPKVMQWAMDMAEETGSGFISVSNSSHFGIAGYHAALAMQKDMIGWAMTNASPLVSPTGSKERLLGTNPIAFAVPDGTASPFLLDMATSAAANGKLEIAKRKQIPIPYGWAIDPQGQESADPEIISKGGSLLPLGSDREHGSHKGYGLASMVDILSGVLGGANFGPWVPPFVAFLNPLDNLPGKGIGHFLGAMDVDAFMDKEDFFHKMKLWKQRFQRSTPIDEQVPVKIAGEIEQKEEQIRKTNGIPLHKEVIKDLQKLGEKLNIKFA
jgi:LDH2 family malate/lactate/ureidoglycolate dehydrogenase